MIKMTSRSCALVVVLVACNSSASPQKAAPSPVLASATPTAHNSASVPAEPVAPPTSAAVPAAPDLETILNFLHDRDAQSKVKPETVNESMAGLGPRVKEQGKAETGWDFRGDAADGLVRSLKVSFVPASKPNGEYIDPPVWQFRTASFLLHSDKPRATYALISDRLNSKFKKPKWKKATSAGWKLKGHWEIWLSSAPIGGGVEVLVTEPEGP